MPRKVRTMLMVEFDKPVGVSHTELRNFIIKRLEMMLVEPVGLAKVKVSKPVIPWREPWR